MRRDEYGSPIGSDGKSIYEEVEGKLVPRGTIISSSEEVPEVFIHLKVTSIKYLPDGFYGVVLLQSIPINVFRSNKKRWKVELKAEEGEENSDEKEGGGSSSSSSRFTSISSSEAEARILFLTSLIAENNDVSRAYIDVK